MKNVTRSIDLELKNQYRKAKIFLKKYSTNYAFATQFLDARSKRETIIAYAFFRYVDEIVDNPVSKEKVIDELLSAKNQWQKIKKDKTIDESNPVVWMYDLCARNNIPFEYVDAFIEAMIADTHKTRYETYEELEKYMYGSASCVGLIMMYIFGFENTDARMYAQKYGEGMQLINFIRDINEDLVKRDRIYIPKEYMDRFNVTENMLQEKIMNKNVEALVSFLSDKSKKIMHEGRKGIVLLSPKVRWPVLAAGDIYEYNLTILKKRKYDIFQKKIIIPSWRKLIISISSLFRLF